MQNTYKQIHFWKYILGPFWGRLTGAMGGTLKGLFKIIPWGVKGPLGPLRKPYEPFRILGGFLRDPLGPLGGPLGVPQWPFRTLGGGGWVGGNKHNKQVELRNTLTL